MMNTSPLTNASSPGGPPRSGNAGIEQRLLLAWKRLDMPPGSPVLLGFSGGPDSLALALALRRIAPLAGFDLHALHVDHGLRPESGLEATRALRLAETIGLRCRVAAPRGDPVQLHLGTGIEEAGRRERFRALTAEASRIGASHCALAHHQDDQAETIMLHLLRGAGLAGAAGMVPVAKLSVPWWREEHAAQRPLMLWRPWLDESRSAIAAYRERIAPELEPVIDPSNDDPSLLRNRVRHQLMPQLEGIRPGARQALARFGALAGEDDRFLDDLARERLDALGARPGDLPVAGLSALPLPLLRRVLRIACMEAGHLSELSGTGVEALVLAVCRGQGGVTIQLGGGKTATIARGRLLVSSNEHRAHPP
ncbi:MAG TPA: tRNA lysidine(34) synthetase TilS [Thermomicrobiales bacterium]|nr:tRNA lysidine(34) synthetase TilS [Thermomicrobiales bacterium]